MMICTLSSGDKSRSIGFGGAAASWDFLGCGSQRGGTGEAEGGKVTPVRRGENVPIVTGKCQHAGRRRGHGEVIHALWDFLSLPARFSVLATE